MKNLELIVAHLLGGTSGLNLSKFMTDREIQEMVAAALRVAREVSKQAKKLKNSDNFDK
jgi:hypothetical protein